MGQLFLLRQWDFDYNCFDLGFVKGLKESDKTFKGLALYQPTVTAAVGAAYLGAKKHGTPLDVKYEENRSIIFETKI